MKIGNLTLDEICTCSNTYKKYKNFINPYPHNFESIQALQNLYTHLLEPVISNYRQDNFYLTYGFCSVDLIKYLNKKDPITNQKNGRICPKIDQHSAHELNSKAEYICSKLGAACDFYIKGLDSKKLVDWIIAKQLRFDSIYYYGSDRPIHISYGNQHKRDIWTFTDKNTPTKKGIENWVIKAKLIK
jgi:hypothetical protein